MNTLKAKQKKKEKLKISLENKNIRYPAIATEIKINGIIFDFLLNLSGNSLPLLFFLHFVL